MLVTLVIPSFSEGLGFDAVDISAIKTHQNDIGGSDLYFMLKNKTDVDVSVAIFECNIFDKSGDFVEIRHVSTSNLKANGVFYAQTQTSLPLSQFGRADCRCVGASSAD
jgi:hypothetical protein